MVLLQLNVCISGGEGANVIDQSGCTISGSIGHMGILRCRYLFLFFSFIIILLFDSVYLWGETEHKTKATDRINYVTFDTW